MRCVAQTRVNTWLHKGAIQCELQTSREELNIRDLTAPAVSHSEMHYCPQLISDNGGKAGGKQRNHVSMETHFV